jgi:hypothetical protein
VTPSKLQVLSHGMHGMEEAFEPLESMEAASGSRTRWLVPLTRTTAMKLALWLAT